MPKYRRKSYVVDAVRWTGDNYNEIAVLLPKYNISHPYARASQDEFGCTIYERDPVRDKSILHIITLSDYVYFGEWVLKYEDGRPGKMTHKEFEEQFELSRF